MKRWRNKSQLLPAWWLFIMVKSRPQLAWRNHKDKRGILGTYRGGDCSWRAVGGREGIVSWEMWFQPVVGKCSPSLKILREGAVKAEAGSFFQCVTICRNSSNQNFPLVRKQMKWTVYFQAWPTAPTPLTLSTSGRSPWQRLTPHGEYRAYLGFDVCHRLSQLPGLQQPWSLQISIRVDLSSRMQ